MQPYDAADTFTSMLFSFDAKDWPGVRRAFADQVDVDYSSLSGVPAARVAADDLVASWQAFRNGIDATQHLTGPILVAAQGNSVTAKTHVRAYHRNANQANVGTWLVAGHYEVRLERIGEHWKIIAITLRVFYQEGALGSAEPVRAR
jgi:hypothetical protein